MKKLLAIVASVALACSLGLALVGCSGGTPADVAKSTLDEVKAQDFNGSLAELKNSIEQSIANAAGSGTELTDAEKAIVDNLLKKMCDFDYVLGEAQVTDDTASVPVTFKTYDIKSAFTNSMKTYLEGVYANALSTGSVPSQDEIVAQYFEALNTEIGALGDKSVTAEGTIKLTKKDGAWVVDELDTATVNAMFGGIGDIENAMSSIAQEFMASN